MKPHKGTITDWIKMPRNGERYVIIGEAVDHPQFAGHTIKPSYVAAHDEATGEIETLNSRYTLRRAVL